MTHREARTPLQVWIVNPFDAPGPAGFRPGRYASLSQRLTRRGHRVVWWTSDFDHRTKTRRPAVAGPPGLCIRTIHARPYAANISVARLVNHAQYGLGVFLGAGWAVLTRRVRRPDVILVSSPPLTSSFLMAILGRLLRCGVVVDTQDAWPETFYRLVPGRALRTVLFRLPLAVRGRSVGLATALSGVAQDYLDLLARTHPRSAGGKPVFFLPLGAELPGEPPRRSPQVRPDQFVYVGSLSGSYDLTTLLQAMARLGRTHPRAHLTIAGAGPDEVRLRRLAGASGLNNITFAGYLNDQALGDLLSRSAFAINAISAGSYIFLPNKVADYLLSGLPIVNSTGGTLARQVDERHLGVNYRAGDVTSLTAAITSLLDEPDRLAALQANARAFGQDQFNRDRTYPAFVRFLETLGETATSPPRHSRGPQQ